MFGVLFWRVLHCEKQPGLRPALIARGCHVHECHVHESPPLFFARQPKYATQRQRANAISKPISNTCDYRMAGFDVNVLCHW
jgi:hypothetical protein